MEEDVAPKVCNHHEVIELPEFISQKRAEGLKSMLKQSYDPDLVRELLKQLQELCKDVDVSLLLSEHQVHRSVILIMKASSLFNDILQLCCNLFQVFIECSDDVCEVIIKADVFRYILQTVKNNPLDFETQITGMKIFSKLLQFDIMRDQLMLDDETVDMARVVYNAIANFQQSVDVQMFAFLAVHNLLAEDPELQESFMKKEFEVLLESLLLHQANPSVIEQIFAVLEVIASNEDLRGVLVTENIHAIVLDKMDSMRNRAEVIQRCCRLLCLLCEAESVREMLHGSGFMKIKLVPLIQNYPEDGFIIVCGLKLFCQLAKFAITEKLNEDHNYLEADDKLLCQEESIDIEWCSVIHTVMSHHLDNRDVQLWSSNALSVFLDYHSEPLLLKGDNSVLLKDPVHTQCLGAILMFRTDPEVFTAACETLYKLAADNVPVCTSLMEKNTHIAVLDGINLHQQVLKAVVAGVMALHGLCIFHEEHKLAVIAEGAQHLLTKIMVRYQESPVVQIQVISTLACLGNINLVRHQCFIDKVHIKIRDLLQRFDDEELLQEAGLECLSVLCVAENGSDLLNSVGMVSCVLNTLYIHRNSINIQKKGLILLQLLASQVMCQDPALREKLAQVIGQAFKSHANEISVLKEACVAVQILSEGAEGSSNPPQPEQGGNVMSNSFIWEGCHDSLFTILKNHGSDPQLQDLASECLYVLGLEQILKSKMLLSVCDKVNIQAAECLLEMGADVNCGAGKETALYLAVENEDENLVRLLLKQHISDLHTPLRRSLEKQRHRITGLLLGCINKERDRCTMSWSGLKLKELHSDWFKMAFTNQSYNSASDVTRQILTKIKRSEEKRAKRPLKQTSSDTKLAQKYRENFRFQYNFRRHHSDKTSNRSSVRRSSLPVIAKELEAVQSSGKRYARLRRPDNRKELVLTPISSPKSSFLSLFAGLTSKVQFTSEEDTLHMEFDETDDQSLPVFVTSYNDDQSHPVFVTGYNADKSHPVFVTSHNDLEEWKSETLSGAMVPFSPADPRRHSIENDNISQTVKGIWKRKNRSPSPCRILNVLHYPSFEAGDNKNEAGHTLSVPTINSDGESSDFAHNTKSYSDQSAPIRERINSADSFSSDQESRRSSVPGTMELLQPSTLDLSCNQLISVKELVNVAPFMLPCFSFLTALYLNDNQLDTIPEALFQYLPKLEYLDVGNNNLTQFPVLALSCTSLRSLDLSRNKIGSIDKLMVNSGLLKLILCHNKLQHFPSTLSEYLLGIESLQISSNDLSDLPKTALRLKELKSLDLSHNGIRKVPDKFLCGCTKLEFLDISNNALQCLPQVAVDLPRLSKLKLPKNRLTEREPFYLPKFVLEVPNLRSVDLCENGLVGLPAPSLWKSQLMKEILVAKNHLTKISLEGAKNWSKLEAFNLSNNNLTDLPKDIGQLSSLTSLDISYNRALTSLPDDLGRCSKMWEMPLKGVGFTLDRIHQGKVKDLITYLHNKLKKATRYYRMKLMLVGYGGRGKSTLLRGLMKQYKKQDLDMPTVGVIVKNWKFERYRHFKDFHGNATYTINTWDFAGQEDFYSTHQCYLSNRAVYLVVIDIRKGDAELNKLKAWLSNIHARAPGCPIIVVGTHADCLSDSKRQHHRDLIKSRLRDLVYKLGLSGVHEFFAVDCTKENPEMEHLREFIKDTIDQYSVKGQPVMGRKVPSDYVKLADILENEARSLQTLYPVITHTQLLKIVEERGLDLHEEDLKQAVRFLHESGVVLHYDDSALHLKDLYFIDPGWLCRMMAQVVTVRQINPFIKDGLLRKADMKLLFTGKKVDGENIFSFPTNLIPQYIKLLEKFEIALYHSEEKLLITCHLPDRRPDIHLPVSKKNEKICRYYAMPLVPLGMWSRLISRLIVFSNSTLTLTLIQERHSQTMCYWKKGIYVYWSNTCFFLLDSHDTREEEEIHITVPATKKGSTLLGLIVDHIDALVEEWYPGLICIDPLQGKELLTVKIPCIHCKDDFDQNIFLMDDLMTHSEQNSDVFCEVHKDYVPLSILAPDLVLNDLSLDLQLDHSKFEYKETGDNLLGDGGYGAVYRGIYRDQAVAVKVFSAIGAVHPHKTQRQEATILRYLHHPSIVQLLGVSFHPRIIVLELAPKGSLGMMLKSGRPVLERLVQQRIALQVAEGLAYLHKLLIVYRDMKPDNILMYSTEPSDPINAKISDYGIARFSTLDGLIAQEGTPAYRAPEVIRGETYSFQADMFSYGITLYALLTGGRHPFDEFEFKSEMDRAIAEGASIPQITRRNCQAWPDMEDILYSCLAQLPDQRPQAQDICDRLKSPELFCLKSTPVRRTGELVLYPRHERDVKVFGSHEDSNGHLTLWFASGDSDYVELGKVNLMDPTMEPEGTYFPHGRILCLEPIDDQYLLVGSQMSRVWLYDVRAQMFKHCTSLLADSVLSMKFIPGSTEAMVFAGLANGMIAVFPVSDIKTEANINPMCLSPGTTDDPVRCMAVQKRWLFASCGSKIVIFSTRRGISLELSFATLKQRKLAPCIYTMALGQSQLVISHMSLPNVQIWELGKSWGKCSTPKLRHTFYMAKLLGLNAKLARVTATTIQQDNSTLWVGLGNGNIALVDMKSMNAISMIDRYSCPIRGLLYVTSKISNQSHKPSFRENTVGYSAVLCGGLGFKERPGALVDREKEYGCLSVWDPDFDQIVRKFHAYLQLRQDKEEEMYKHH